jgi:hypothetical protein
VEPLRQDPRHHQQQQLRAKQDRVTTRMS